MVWLIVEVPFWLPSSSLSGAIPVVFAAGILVAATRADFKSESAQRVSLIVAVALFLGMSVFVEVLDRRAESQRTRQQLAVEARVTATLSAFCYEGGAMRAERAETCALLRQELPGFVCVWGETPANTCETTVRRVLAERERVYPHMLTQEIMKDRR